MYQQYGNIYGQIKNDLANSTYIRFYTQQDSYQCDGEHLLHFNKLINQTINQLMILNTGIYKNSRISTSTLDNGRQIFNKKKMFWEQFLKQQVYSHIRNALQCLSQRNQEIKVYTILTLSNLLLKLGINMSKISVILLQKQLSFNCLDVTTLAVLFLQYLEYKLFKSKKIQQQKQGSLFLRQLPKITVIRIAQQQNNRDLQTLQNTQNYVFSQGNQKPIKNLQYFDLYEQDDINYEWTHTNPPYQFITSINVKKLFNIHAPYSFELLFLMRNIIFGFIKNFQPDLILFVESYPSDQIIIQSRVRALLISQLMTEGTPKIYVFREVGFSQNPKNIPSQLNKQYVEQIENQRNQQCKNLTPCDPKSREKHSYLQKGKKILLNDIAYSAIALIQKSPFYQLTEQSHVKHKRSFVIRIIKFLQEISQKQIKKTQTSIFVESKIKNLTKMLPILPIENQKDRIQQQGIEYNKIEENYQFKNYSLCQEQFSEFFNLRQEVSQKLNMDDGSLCKFTQKQQIYIHYQCDGVIVFILGYYKYSVLRRSYQNDKFNYIKRQSAYGSVIQHLIGCTLIASDRYLYRGFGQPIESDQKFETHIFRFPLQSDENTQWQIVSNCCYAYKENGKNNDDKQPMDRLKFGYGFYNQRNRLIVMLGGFMNTVNYQKICKHIYVFKADLQYSTVTMIGKTTQLLFRKFNQPKSKHCIHPFIYGLPFIGNKCILILNSNGYQDILNNSYKIYLSIFNDQTENQKYGIFGIKQQFKIEAQNSVIEILHHRDHLLSLMLKSYNRINRYGNLCCLQTLQEGLWVIQLAESQKKVIVRGMQIETKQQFSFYYLIDRKNK